MVDRIATSTFNGFIQDIRTANLAYRNSLDISLDNHCDTSCVSAGRLLSRREELDLLSSGLLSGSSVRPGVQHSFVQRCKPPLERFLPADDERLRHHSTERKMCGRTVYRLF